MTLARLTLLAGLAATQLTLVVRAGVMDAAIMAALCWIGGGLLLSEWELERQAPPLARIPWSRFGPGLLLVGWCLLVLTGAARLHDPLFWLVPAAALPGLGWLAGAPWRSALMARLGVIGLLLPAQGLFNAVVPTGLLALVTARLSALVLWLVGRPAFADGPRIVMDGQVLLVDASCTGRTTLGFCLATLVLLGLLFPLPFRRRARPLLAALLVAVPVTVLLLNALRIALLAFMEQDPGPGLLSSLRSFAFWHGGPGAQLFSLLASGLVCGLYLLLLEVDLRRRRGLQR